MALERIDGIFCTTSDNLISEEHALEDIVQTIARNAFSISIDDDLHGKTLKDILQVEWGHVELSHTDYEEITLLYKKVLSQCFERLVDHMIGI